MRRRLCRAHASTPDAAKGGGTVKNVISDLRPPRVLDADRECAHAVSAYRES